MPDHPGLPAVDDRSPTRLGVLLVNLGTPDDPSPAAVRRFLAEFLSDPRVIETPRWIWWPILHGFILRFRPRRSAHAYQQVWTPQGSPLLLHGVELADRLRRELVERLGPDVRVELGMTYGSPSIRSGIDALCRDGVHRIVVLPLYPQYSGTTTASVFDRVSLALRRIRSIPGLHFIADYHRDPAYIEAIADSVRTHWRMHARDHLLFSFHGIPRSYVDAGDPYYSQCQATAALVARSLGLGADDWSMSFQSQVGRAEWLRPYTDELLLEFARGNRKRVTVICPGFAADCLETLEEIAIRNREAFLAGGGESFQYVPSLNASAAHVSLLADLVMRNADGRHSDTAAPQHAVSAGAAR